MTRSEWVALRRATVVDLKSRTLERQAAWPDLQTHGGAENTVSLPVKGGLALFDDTDHTRAVLKAFRPNSLRLMSWATGELILAGRSASSPPSLLRVGRQLVGVTARGFTVWPLNGDPLDVRVGNLKVVSPVDLAVLTGRRKPYGVSLVAQAATFQG